LNNQENSKRKQWNEDSQKWRFVLKFYDNE
jgi:hypothetical protein